MQASRPLEQTLHIAVFQPDLDFHSAKAEVLFAFLMQRQQRIKWIMEKKMEATGI